MDGEAAFLLLDRLLRQAPPNVNNLLGPEDWRPFNELLGRLNDPNNDGNNSLMILREMCLRYFNLMNELWRRHERRLGVVQNDGNGIPEPQEEHLNNGNGHAENFEEGENEEE